MVIRGLNHGALICVTSLAFKYAALSGLNFGIVSSLFTSAVVFSAIIFYVLYREKIHLKDWLAMFLIIAGVVLISLGKPDESSKQPTKQTLDNQTSSPLNYMTLSLLFALLSGFLLALNSLVMKHYIRNYNFDVVQLNLDGYLICSLFLATCFICYGPTNYSWIDIARALACSIFSLTAFASMA